jgi:hypothetical protein
MSPLPTPLRLWFGAALCVLPIGLVWSTTPGFVTLGTTLYGDCSYSVETYCVSDTYIPGTYLPGHHVLGAQTSARVFLVLAAALLVFAATRLRTEFTKRLVRVATAAMAIAVVLALSNRAILTSVCLAIGLGLVGPLVWRQPGRPAVFVPRPIRR